MTEKILRTNDFFCGGGGMGLGFKYAGFRLAGAWDFDKYAVESYGNNVSPKVKQADITQMKWDEIPYADVWTFGFPCQDLSVAGKQAGLFEGKRSGLFFEVMRLLDETRENDVNRLPDIIMAENVKGLKPYLEVLKEEYNKRGYRMTYTLYNSKYWGVPQNRERYFVVGIRQEIRKAFQFPRQQTDFVPKLSSILEDEVDEKFYIDNEKAQNIIEQAKKRVEIKGTHACLTPDRAEKRQNGRRAKEDDEEMFTLTAQDHHGIIVLGRAEGINGHDILKRVYDTEGISPTLNTCGGGNTQPKILVVGNLKPDGSSRIGTRDAVWDSEGLGGCIMASDYKQPRPILHNFRVRKLTPREYARLQGFPDSYKFVVSNSQLYKQFGNAVTVNVAQAIAEKIKEYLFTISK